MEETLMINSTDQISAAECDGEEVGDDVTDSTDENTTSDESKPNEEYSDENNTSSDAEPDEEYSDEVGLDGDLDELKREFGELADISSIENLRFPEKYKRFREMGLNPVEAYMATGESRAKERYIPTSPLSVSRRAEGIPQRQLRMAREIFEDLSDMEIQALYKRVTK